MKRCRIQAKDIADDTMLDVVRATRGQHGVPEWATLGDIQAAMPTYPPKVVTTKLASMVRRGIIYGCACGCRGDFGIPSETEAKAPTLVASPPAYPPVIDIGADFVGSIMADYVRRSVIVTFQDGTTAEVRTFYGALIIDARHADRFDLASRHRLPVTVVRQGGQPFAAYVVDVDVVYRFDNADPYAIVHLEPLTTPQPRGSSDSLAASRSLASERVEEESGSSPTPPQHPQPPTTSPAEPAATFLAASHDGASSKADDTDDDNAAAAKVDEHYAYAWTAFGYNDDPTVTTHQGVTVGHNAAATTTSPTCCENAPSIRKNSP